MSDVSGSNAKVIDLAEESLGKEVSAVEARAMQVVVGCDADYVDAGESIKTVKQMQKKVTEYWEPLRLSAKKTYDDVLGKKKQMLQPLEKAESILKRKMADYAKLQEAQRQERERTMRLLASQEAEKKIAEAARAEASGDTFGAEYAMAEAEVMEDVARNGSVAAEAPKAAGVSMKKAWKIIGVDPSKVPTEIAGAIIRPVDESAVMALIKASKGSIQIPGIEYVEDVRISVRA